MRDEGEVEDKEEEVLSLILFPLLLTSVSRRTRDEEEVEDKEEEVLSLILFPLLLYPSPVTIRLVEVPVIYGWHLAV